MFDHRVELVFLSVLARHFIPLLSLSLKKFSTQIFSAIADARATAFPNWLFVNEWTKAANANKLKVTIFRSWYWKTSVKALLSMCPVTSNQNPNIAHRHVCHHSNSAGLCTRAASDLAIVIVLLEYLNINLTHKKTDHWCYYWVQKY